MKFADQINRDLLDIVFIKSSERDFEDRGVYHSNLWDIEKYRIGFDESSNTKVNLYSVPCNAVKIGENIYNKEGCFVTYRSN